MSLPWRWIVPLAVAPAIWILPHGGFDARSWGLLCLFASTVCALITRPVAAGVLMITVIAVGALLRLFTIQDGLSGYANVTVWLIFAAFLFARGLVLTRLGERIAYGIVKRVGGSPLGLGYSIVLADLVMAPMTASNTARAGGILFPVTLNVARAFGSEPGPTASRIGSFLMLALYHGDLVVSAMFLTACAPNPLVADIVRQQSGARMTWTVWALAASVPGLVALVVIPYLVYRLAPPVDVDTAAAFGVLSSVNAALTHYGSGPAPIVFGAGYVSQPAGWRIGFILSVAHLLIWLPIGFVWWRVLGLW